MTSDEFTELALGFPGTIQKPHFDRISFKIEGKRIFATLQVKSSSVNMRLELKDQEIYSAINPDLIFPVQNKWGLQGWTTFLINEIEDYIIRDALDHAHQYGLEK